MCHRCAGDNIVAKYYLPYIISDDSSYGRQATVAVGAHEMMLEMRMEMQEMRTESTGQFRVVAEMLQNLDDRLQ